MFVWNVDPEFFTIPVWGRAIRYYGVLYAMALMGGFYWWRWQMRRAGHPDDRSERFLTLAVIATIAGARLGHCFFYDWHVYGGGLPWVLALVAGLYVWGRYMLKSGVHLFEVERRLIYGMLVAVALAKLYQNTLPPSLAAASPLRVFFFWEGGLASHGTTIVIIGAMLYFGRTEGMPGREVVDRMAITVAWGACLIRLGNLMNSEIVGRVTDSTWGVKFLRYEYLHVRPPVKRVLCEGSCSTAPADMCAMFANKCLDISQLPWRHPSQLYEASLGMGILILLLIVDRVAGQEKRPLGLLGSLFLLLYFVGRFSVEYVKEFQTLQEGLTMGQYLSIPFIVIGAVGVVHSLVKRESPPPPAPRDSQEALEAKAAA